MTPRQSRPYGDDNRVKKLAWGLRPRAGARRDTADTMETHYPGRIEFGLWLYARLILISGVAGLVPAGWNYPTGHHRARSAAHNPTVAACRRQCPAVASRQTGVGHSVRFHLPPLAFSGNPNDLPMRVVADLAGGSPAGFGQTPDAPRHRGDRAT